MPILTSREGTLAFGPGLPTMLVNDQLFVFGQAPTMLDQLVNGQVDLMVEMARWGKVVGMDVVAILIAHPEIDEVEMLPKIALAVHTEVGCPIGFDSRHPEALEAALSAMQPHKCIVWTVTAEQEVIDDMLPIIRRYNAVIAGMPMGRFSRHVPMTAEGRLAEAQAIVEACEGYGIPREDIVIDAVCMAASALIPDSYRVTLETLKTVRQVLGVATQLGISNAGHGMPDPTRMDMAYLLGAMPWGLDAVFVNPATLGLVECVRAMDMLVERDETGKRYIDHWRSIYGSKGKRNRPLKSG